MALQRPGRRPGGDLRAPPRAPPAEGPRGRARAHEQKFRVKVSEVKERDLPPLDDAFAAKVNAEIQDLRGAARGGGRAAAASRRRSSGARRATRRSSTSCASAIRSTCRRGWCGARSRAWCRTMPRAWRAAASTSRRPASTGTAWPRRCSRWPRSGCTPACCSTPSPRTERCRHGRGIRAHSGDVGSLTGSLDPGAAPQARRGRPPAPTCGPSCGATRRSGPCSGSRGRGGSGRASGYNVEMTEGRRRLRSMLIPMVVEQIEPGRARLRHLLAPAQGQHHLPRPRDRRRRRQPDHRPDALPRGREPREGHLPLHQLARAARSAPAWRSTTPCSTSSPTSPPTAWGRRRRWRPCCWRRAPRASGRCCPTAAC